MSCTFWNMRRRAQKKKADKAPENKTPETKQATKPKKGGKK